MYSEKVLDHFTNPRNVGEIPDADGVGEVGNARCGDIMKMYLKIDGDTITDVKFKTFGCGAAIATSSIATEMIKGHSINEALALSNRAVVEALDGLPPAKLHCSVLAEQAVKAALSDYYTRQGIDPEPIVGHVKRMSTRAKRRKVPAPPAPPATTENKENPLTSIGWGDFFLLSQIQRELTAKVFGQAFFKRLAVFGRAVQSAKFPVPEGTPQGDEFAK